MHPYHTTSTQQINCRAHRRARHMVTNYVKKGGHGGKRRGSGLGVGHWENQGGRKAAAAAKAAREAVAKAAKETAKRKAGERWAQWTAPSAKQPKQRPRAQDICSKNIVRKKAVRQTTYAGLRCSVVLAVLAAATTQYHRHGHANNMRACGGGGGAGADHRSSSPLTEAPAHSLTRQHLSDYAFSVA